MSRKTAWLNVPLFVAVLALIVWWWWRETERQTRPAAGLMGRRRPPGPPARPPQRTYGAPHAVSHVPPAEPVVPAEPELAEEVAAEPEDFVEEPMPAEPEVPAEPEPEPALPAEEPAEKAEAEAEKQNLKRIEGIGPKIESVLHAAGVLSYAQLAESTPAQLQEILDDARIRIADPTTWPEQAALAAAGDWQGLELLQSQLKGGRRVA
jgi:predicted flap endonuclease-1-like 5' DNA nuclease